MTTTQDSDKSRAEPRIRILLVDPDEKNTEAIHQALADVCDPGSGVDRCDDTQTALTNLSRGGDLFDAVVVSNGIPVSDGVEIHKRLRETDVVIPVVLLIDAGHEDEAAEALRAGVNDVVMADPSGGYLKLLPERLSAVVRGRIESVSATKARVAIIVQADTESTDYTHAERWLRDTDPMWQALVESPFQYFMLVDRETVIQYLNKTAPGIEFEDVIGKQSICDFAPPDQQGVVRAKFEYVFRTGEAAHYDLYIPLLDQWYTISAGPVYQAGEIIGASVFARDITEQKRIESQLETSERRMRGLTEAIPHVFYVHDPINVKTLYVSPTYEEIYGRSLKTLYENARDWLDAVHPDDRQRVEGQFAKLLLAVEEEYEWEEFRIVKPDGAIRWLHHRAYLMRGDSGDEVHIACVAADVTAEREARERLRESEQQYRMLIDQASDGIFVADVDGVHVDVNAAGCEMLGYTREEILALNLRDLMTEEDLDKAPPRVERLEEGEAILTERRLKRKDGSTLPVEVNVKMLPNRLLQAIVRDITERKHSEEELQNAHDELERRVEERTRELEAANEAYRKTERLASIGTLAAGIAHEINNPLGSIIMAADSALYSLENSEDVEEALRSIKADSKRAGRIVKTVLQFSRQEESHKRPYALGDIAHRARDLTQGYAETNEVAVELTIASDLPKVAINPTEIEQVLVNIINNAIEASDRGQTVTLRITADDSNVRAVLEDRGRGIKPEEIDRVFDPFFTTRHDIGGTGLGLSLTHSIVDQHGGSIDIESVPDEGTRVSVNLPLGNNQNTRSDDSADER
jgi:PAS domain S-box-containing protein